MIARSVSFCSFIPSQCNGNGGGLFKRKFPEVRGIAEKRFYVASGSVGMVIGIAVCLAVFVNATHDGIIGTKITAVFHDNDLGLAVEGFTPVRRGQFVDFGLCFHFVFALSFVCFILETPILYTIWKIKSMAK